MTKLPQVRDALQPVFVAQEDTPTWKVWQALDGGQPVALHTEDGWRLLPPDAAAGYPRTRRLIDLPLRPVVLLPPEMATSEAVERLDSIGERFGLVMEGEQVQGVVSFRKLLALTLQQVQKAATLGRFLGDTLDASRALVWRIHLPRPLDDIRASFSFKGAKLESYGVAERVTGYSNEEMQAKPWTWLAYLHPQDRAVVRTKGRQLLAQGSLTWRFRFRHRQGHWVWLQSQVSVEKDGRGRLTDLYCVTVDVTRDVQAQEEERLLSQIHKVLAERQPGQALERVFEILGESLPIDNASIFIVDGKNFRMESSWVRPGWEEAIKSINEEVSRRMRPRWEGLIPPALGGSFLEAIQSQRPVYIPDFRQREGPTAGMLAQHGLRTAFILPLVHRRDFNALLNLTSGQVNVLSEVQCSFLERLAPTLAAAVDAWRFEQELQELNASLEEKVHQRTFELEILYELAQQLGYALNYDELFRQMVQQLHRAVDYDVVATLLDIEGVRELLIYPARPLSPGVSADLQERLQAAFKTMSKQPLKLDEFPTYTHNAVTWDQDAAPVERLDSVFLVPLVVGKEQETVGLLLVGAEAAGAFSEDQVRLLYTVAHQARVSVQRLRALLAVEQQRLESLIEYLPAGVLLLNAGHRILLANPTGREYLPLLTKKGMGEVLTHLVGQSLEGLLETSAEEPVELHPLNDANITFELHSRTIRMGPEKGGHVLVIRDVTWERELLAAEQSRREELDALYDLAGQLVASDDLEHIYTVIAREAVEKVRITFGYLLTLEDDGHFYCRALHSLREMEAFLPLNDSLPSPAHTLLHKLMGERKPVVWRGKSLKKNHKLLQALKLSSLESICFVPLYVGDAPLGLLLLGETRHEVREPFSKEKLRLAAAIADQASSAIHRSQLHQQVKDAFQEVQVRAEKMEQLAELSAVLNRTNTMEKVLAAIGEGGLVLSATDRAAVYLRQPDDTITCPWLRGVSETYVQTLTHRALDAPGGNLLSQTEPVLFEEMAAAPDFLRQMAAAEGIEAVAIWPLVYEGQVIAALGCYYDHPHHWSETEREVMRAFGNQAAVALQNTRLYVELEESYVETVLALAKAMDARDSYTGNHSQRLAEWAEATARQLGCDGDEIEAIHWAAQLHDIGKIGVPDAILLKAGPLDEEEWEVMKRHPAIGAEIVTPVKKLANVAPIIRAHQEKYDGSGYPDGLKGEEIPRGARILAVVDAYGAITDERSYKKARSHEDAVAELRRCAGTHFDPQFVEAFLKVLGRRRSQHV